jgi:hypothetical protein
MRADGGGREEPPHLPIDLKLFDRAQCLETADGRGEISATAN